MTRSVTVGANYIDGEYINAAGSGTVIGDMICIHSVGTLPISSVTFLDMKYFQQPSKRQRILH